MRFIIRHYDMPSPLLEQGAPGSQIETAYIIRNLLLNHELGRNVSQVIIDDSYYPPIDTKGRYVCIRWIKNTPGQHSEFTTTFAIKPLVDHDELRTETEFLTLDAIARARNRMERRVK